MQLVFNHQPDVQYMSQLHLHIELKWDPQRRLRIYIGLDSPSIIKYLEPLTGDFFTARFADCHFD